MLLPANEPVFAGLRTSFLRFDALLAELHDERLSGYVIVEFPGYCGTILFLRGDVVSATERTTTGESSSPIRSVSVRANEPGGLVGIYRLPFALVEVLASAGSGEVLYRDLSSAFTSLERLLAKLNADFLCGYVEARFVSGDRAGTIFVRDGMATQAIYSEGNSVVTGEGAIHTIVEASATDEAVFNVYRTERGADQEPPSSGDGGTKDEIKVEIPVIVEAPTPIDMPISASAMSPEAGKGVLAVWSDILRRVEEVVDGLSHRGAFQAALHEAFLERAAVYPYLDPFALEFAYRDGEAMFDGEIPENLPEALTNSLHDAIARLAFRLKRSDIEARVRTELVEVRDRHQAVIQGFPASARALVS